MPPPSRRLPWPDRAARSRPRPRFRAWRQAGSSRFGVQLLPTVDVASQTLELRLDLPPDTGAAPGMFARAWLPGPGPGAGSAEARLFVPSQALVRRSELAAVYVIGRDGKPLLRQVRPGRSEGSQVEILSGVAAGERVALDPQAAARIR